MSATIKKINPGLPFNKIYLSTAFAPVFAANFHFLLILFKKICVLITTCQQPQLQL